MKKFRKLSKLLVICAMALSMTGCDTVHPDTESDLATRINLNLDELKIMQETGFINQEQYNQLKKALDETEQKIRSALSGNSTALKYIGPSIVSVNEKAKNASELVKYMGGEMSEDAVGFTEDSEKLLAQVAKVDLYVLKPLGTGKTLDDVITQVNRYIGSKKDDFETYLGDYFTPAKTYKLDGSGNKVYENGVAVMENVTMELPPVLAKTTGPGNNAELGKHFVATGWQEFKVCNHTHGGKNPDCTESGSHACNQYYTAEDEEAGYGNEGDVKCSVTKAVEKAARLCEIRLYEVNPDFMNVIKSMDDSEDPNYIFHRDSAGGVRMVLLNYPVNYIDKITKVGTENDTFKSTMKASEDMFVNLKQGKLKRKVEVSGQEAYTDVAQNGSSLYITDTVSLQTMAGYKSDKTIATQGLSGSSFVMYGSSEMKMDTTLVPGKEKIKTITGGSILLRDYIETVYMPGVSNEKWVATGRKIRFEQFEGSSKLPWASYVDNSGDPYLESHMPRIYLQDLLENFSGHTGGSEFFNKLRPDNSFTKGLVGDYDPVKDDDNNGRIDGSSLDARLQTYYKDELSVAFPMPGEYIDAAEMNNQQTAGTGTNTQVNPVIYCIKTDKSMFETKLKAEWLADTDPMNSVVWWNTWLMNNGLSYQLDINNSVAYFEGTYGYEASKDGYINFNLDTIQKLQNKIDTQKNVQNIRLIRAVFISFGIILMFYGLLLLGAWAFDVNVSIGMPLLKLLTFGKMVAVTENLDGNGESYNIGGKNVAMITFKSILLISLGVSLAGVVCTFFDIIGIVDVMLRTFTTIAIQIYNAIF